MMGLWWLKILLPILLVGGVMWHFKTDRDVLRDLGSAQKQVTTLETTLATRDTEIATLNSRIKKNNADKLRELADAELIVIAANKAAEESIAERRRLAGDLTEARKKYQEMVNADPNLRIYRSTTVPTAVLDRLRSANGENH